ncbi:MAG: adenylate/guanylate cyclase domain-containing protein [Tepidiformaceae bacterium]
MKRGERRLPSGIVTFVFSDIEGSTRLFKRLGDRYPELLDRHRTLLRSAWKSYGGEEVNTEGDGSFVAFADTTSALQACAQGQRLIRAEPWAEGIVRVRMGVHSGLAAPHNNDYVALAVHQAARFMKAAHGAQVLVSAEAAALAAPTADLTLTPLGRFRLPDFDEPVRIFQLAAPLLEEQFPAIRALPAEGHNLVRPPNTFVGRDDEVATVLSRLGPGRAVTIVGPGGVGKTRLATEVGVRVADAWPDGVWAVDLAMVEDAALIADGIGDAVGARAFANGAPGADRWDEVLDHLRLRRALVLLDNAEVHVERCARLVAELVHACPGVGILTTSREPLRVAGEDIVRLGPLPLPGPLPGSVELGSAPAMRLFVDRARTARPGLDLEGSTLAAIAAICRRLDGLPLAIEIAAARTAVLDPPAILAGLNDMFRMLRSRDRSLPERQRTMQALLDWSYRLLDVDEQAALRRLAVFSGGFSKEAAMAAVGDGRPAAGDVPELVWSLVDRSLLGADLTANDTRYRFLETVRHYARLLLDDASETGPVALRLSAWFLERLGPWRSADRAWIGDLSLELDNLRTVIPLVAPHDPAAAQQLACSVGRYRDAVHAFRLGIDEVSRFVAELQIETPSRVALLTTLADLWLRIGDVDNARVVLGEAEDLRRRVGPAPWDDAGVERTTGEIATRTGDLQRAAAIASEALGRSLSPRGRARMWDLLGLAKSASGDLRGAFDAFGQERAELVASGHEASLAGAEGNLAEIALRLGDTAMAAHHQRACLELALALGQPVLLAYSLIVAARLAAASGDWPTATRLQARAGAMLNETGWRLYDDDLRASEQWLADAREHLGGQGFDAAVRDGTAMDAPAAAASADEVLRAAAGVIAARAGA